MESFISSLRGDRSTARAKAQAAQDQGIELIHWVVYRPMLLRQLPDSVLPAWPNFAQWIEDYPELIAAYQGLGIDIVGEIEASRLD